MEIVEYDPSLMLSFSSSNLVGSLGNESMVDGRICLCLGGTSLNVVGATTYSTLDVAGGRNEEIVARVT